MMKKIKDEIARIEGAKGNVVLVNKKSYLSLLKELSVLRFKVHRAENWETPAAVVSLVRHGYMYQYIGQCFLSLSPITALIAQYSEIIISVRPYT